MNGALVDRIADAVLYEGYILYPYRPSVKNRQRWTFGGLYPEEYAAAQGDASASQTECLLQGTRDTVLGATVRFLHLTDRLVGEIVPPLSDWPAGPEPPFRPVAELRVGDRVYHGWQEAEERSVALNDLELGAVLATPRETAFRFPGRRWLEPVYGPGGEVAGVLVRRQQEIAGAVAVTAARVGEGLYRITLRVVNRTPPGDEGTNRRDEAVLRALVSTHAILGARGGEFVSLIDPPEACRAAAAACRNVGVWPVLVGEEGQKDTMLSSPIILYDYPQVAPESPGDLFDGAEIDEILTLRILSLTDEEKRTMAAVDGRARELLARTEGLPPEQLLGLHGTLRTLRPLGGNGHD